MLDNIVVLDFETTGLCPLENRVIEIGAIAVRGGLEVGRFQCFVRQDESQLSAENQAIHGITPAQVAAGFGERLAFALLKNFISQSVIVAHNAAFDVGFLNSTLQRLGANDGADIGNAWLCTQALAQAAMPGLKSNSLGALCMAAGVDRSQSHRALGDCADTVAVLCWLLEEWDKQERKTLPLNAISAKYELSANQAAALPVGRAWRIEKGGRDD